MTEGLKNRGVENIGCNSNKPSITLSPCRVPQHCGVFCTAKYRGGVRRTEGLIKQRGLEYKQKQQSPIPPLSGGEAARETRRREKGEECLSGASSADPDGDRSDKPKGPITAAAFLGSFFSLLRRTNQESELV